MAALWIDGPASRPLAALLAASFGVSSATCLLWPWPRPGLALACFGAAFGAVLFWWLSIEPRNDRDWLPDVARTPRATIDGDHIRISNIRNFSYRSEDDYTERWEERTYDLSKLQGVDLFLIYWGSPMIAHTIVSWRFEDVPPLAISIETRKERGEAYSALLGFFRQFELYYVVADERDVVRLRTNYRDEDVYLYPLRTPREAARAILLDYLRTINQLAERPKWYNALLHNCTTTIRYHIQHVTPGNPWSWKIILNGYIDELAYERGTIDNHQPFETLRARSQINAVAQAANQDSAFSRRIRQTLPGVEAASRVD